MKHLKDKKKSTISAQHLLYLKKIRRNKIIVHTVRAFILIAVIGLWELCARVGVFDPFITSSPSRVVSTIADLAAAGTLFYHIGITLMETVTGFVIAVVAGYLIAVLLWTNDAVRKIFEPYIVVLNALPKIALGPLIIIWMGTGYTAIIFMTVLVSIIVCIMNMLAGFVAVDKTKAFNALDGRKQADNADKTCDTRLPPRLYEHFESGRRACVDWVDYGRIHRLARGAGVPHRIRRAGFQARPRNGGHVHTLPACGRNVRNCSHYRTDSSKAARRSVNI